ncbi:MAG: hypothetical protein MJZ81_10100 [Bacteroidales bacterium]|nr:hypothetical protein [Bacteroidales bacterium]
MTPLRKSILLIFASIIMGVAAGWHTSSDGLDLSHEVSSCDFQDDENFDILVQSPHDYMLVSETDFGPCIPIHHIHWLMEDTASEGAVTPIGLPLRAPPVVG